MVSSQTLLMLGWRSCSWWGRQRVASSVAYNGGQYPIYDCLQPIATQITRDARPTIVDALLMLIFRMGQGACCSLFCPSRRPIPHLWMAATNCHSENVGCKTNNHGRIIEAHLATGVSAICYRFIWHSISLMVFWKPFYRLHVLSPLTLPCS